MPLLTALLNIAIFQGIVLGIIILRSPVFRSDANKYLAYAVFVLSVSLLNMVLEFVEADVNGFLVGLVDVVDSATLLPVFVFLFIANQVDHPFRRSRKRWLLFAPYVMSLAISGMDRIVDFTEASAPAQLLFSLAELTYALVVLLFIPGILYYAYSFIRHTNDKREQRWLTQLWFWIFMILISWIVSLIISGIFTLNVETVMRAIALFATLLIHWITYVGIFKLRLAKDQEEIKALIGKWKSGSVKPAIPPSPLTPVSDEKRTVALTEENAYFKKLETLCADERIYLDNTLDRAQVAEMLGISPGYVSQLVNTITGDNFSTYINRYRVAAVKVMVADAEFDNYSLLAIGLESGFSSKTTFHTAFKKLTGMTPNAYRKTHQ